MCGISCVISVAGITKDGTGSHSSPIVTASQLEASLATISHRGPDAQGTWLSEDGRVGLGHCRLAINDLRPEAAQPLHSRDGRVHAVVNGEIYDFERLRTELQEQDGYIFQTQSDSEVALALYQQYGADFVHHLRGEFAICIYDERTRTFLAVRDRYGIKPLFYTMAHGRLLVAAEIKAFLPLEWKAEWDVRSIREAGWTLDDRTLYKGVKKLMPGHLLVCQNGEVDERSYWDLTYPDKHHIETRSAEEMIAGVRERLLESIRLRLRADVPIGIYLSGGIDSSAIAGIVSYLIREEGLHAGSIDSISCFSIAFDRDSGYDESDIAKRTADWLGVRYVEKHMDEAALAGSFAEATWHCEHQMFDLGYVGKFCLSQVVRDQGFKVVLTGEGSDEHFAGYPILLPDLLAASDHPFEQGFTDEQREAWRLEQEEAASRFVEALWGGNIDRNKVREVLGLFIPTIIAAWPSSFFFKGDITEDPRRTVLKATSNAVREAIAERWHPLNGAAYLFIKDFLHNILLSCVGDRTEMAHSVEARPPFLDHVLTEYVNAIPPSLKARRVKDGFVTKWILREAVRPFVRDELYLRKKQSFLAPTTWPENGPLHRLFTDLLREENIRRLGFVDWTSAQHLVTDAFTKKDTQALRCCCIIGQWVVLSQRFNIPPAADL